MSEIKPWAPPAGYVPPKDGLGRMVAKGVRYILVPDNGSYVPVPAEEWAKAERDHRAMEELRTMRGMAACALRGEPVGGDHEND